MRVVLLGTAASGGFPRWNCGCTPCAAARDGKLPTRTQEAAAVTGNSRDHIPAVAGLRTPAHTGAGCAADMVDRYAPWEWHDSLTAGGFVLSGGLVVTAHPVGASAPAYLPRRAADECWVTAYRVEDLATGGVLVYAPRLAGRDAKLDELLAGADCAVLDGTYVTTADAALSPSTRIRRVHTRLEDASPLFDPASAARGQAVEAGIEVLSDGAEFVL
ncbi:coenzyme PQQ synthesis protein B [Streptomyces spinoverrucosus]|uniref:Coenzyme PQQ synthesis protein B n=1 Tax=Streptomyces spinoverrucosus TaxID=284043 RepID=A0A4Y3VHW8_9ACTN|nr:MBL fold metallo-hydrolase [Streptomyces spinoverrucosus]GEC05410.1 coenzyme PQQ synthesis protein B [Streptomyces spinoverrucosus]GHB78613.1 coenzyme PQQ synthesis protein B [Streptomyces spinoverrucosus]